jgi:hypothetical protein
LLIADPEYPMLNFEAGSGLRYRIAIGRHRL